MFEPTVLNYLTEKLENVPVLMELPEVPSADYPEFPYPLVVIQNVGHTRDDFIDRVSLAFQSYGSTLYNAAALDEAVRNAIDQIIKPVHQHSDQFRIVDLTGRHGHEIMAMSSGKVNDAEDMAMK